MKLSQALSYTGNEYQAMSYDELEEVTRALAEAARKRISRSVAASRKNKKSLGPAYMKLLERSTGEGYVKKVEGLNFDGNIVRISQRFKGKNRMSMSDLRTLRKVLYDYIKDPTSTISGLDDFHKKVEERIKEEERKKKEANAEYDLGDEWMTDNEWDIFDQALTDSELIHFGEIHLNWSSDDIKNAIVESGDYKMRGTKLFSALLREYVEDATTQKYGPRPEDPMEDF